MKKLVVVAAIALTAVYSQAASMKWTMSADASDAGLTVYLVSALSEFTDEASVRSSVIGTDGNSGTIVAGRTTGASGTVGGLDDGKAGQMQDFYYVIVSGDGKGYWASGKQSAEIYTTATTHTDSNIAASTFKTGNYTAWSTGGGSGGSGGVPEPTSGLLLLVGGAMLALRRKQK